MYMMNMKENTLCEYLISHNLKISLAESCTGGMVAEKITSVSGASACFECGVVTYSNEQKEHLLKVKNETLCRFGAVSEETALEMCSGVKNLAAADIGIGITGIAGPTGGSKEKPVGLVYIGVCTNREHFAKRFVFSGNRTEVRTAAAQTALSLALEAAKKLSEKE